MTADAGVTVASINGREYRIPDLWLAGYCASGLDGRPTRSLMDAVAWWAWQEELREQKEADR